MENWRNEFLGKRVIISIGYGYSELYPVLNFRRAIEELRGTVYAVQNCDVYVKLDTGQKIKTGDGIRYE